MERNKGSKGIFHRLSPALTCLHRGLAPEFLVGRERRCIIARASITLWGGLFHQGAIKYPPRYGNLPHPCVLFCGFAHNPERDTHTGPSGVRVEEDLRSDRVLEGSPQTPGYAVQSGCKWLGCRGSSRAHSMLLVDVEHHQLLTSGFLLDVPIFLAPNRGSNSLLTTRASRAGRLNC